MQNFLSYDYTGNGITTVCKLDVYKLFNVKINYQLQFALITLIFSFILKNIVIIIFFAGVTMFNILKRYIFIEKSFITLFARTFINLMMF